MTHPQFTPRDIERFWSYVDRSGGPDACWTWIGGRFKNGYGRFHVGATSLGAHCVSYVLRYGAIPNGMCVCHNCPGGDNRWCVNPSHLWMGSKADNAKDMIGKGRANGNRPSPVVRAALAQPYVGVGWSHPGERNPYAKLTDATVVTIRARYTGRRGEIAALAREFGVSDTLIGKIVKHQSWKHLP